MKSAFCLIQQEVLGRVCREVTEASTKSLMHQIEREERVRSGMFNTEGQTTWGEKKDTQETKGHTGNN